MSQAECGILLAKMADAEDKPVHVLVSIWSGRGARLHRMPTQHIRNQLGQTLQLLIAGPLFVTFCPKDLARTPLHQPDGDLLSSVACSHAAKQKIRGFRISGSRIKRRAKHTDRWTPGEFGC
jgi:hypothetical protein